LTLGWGRKYSLHRNAYLQPIEGGPVKFLLSSVAVATFLLGNSYSACAQSEITLLAPGPIREPLDKLIAGFEGATKYKVRVTYGTGVSTRQDVARGKGLDVSIMFSPFPEAVASGNVVRNSATVLARLRLAIAVKKGAPRPDISSPEAVKRMLTSAKSIITVDPEQGSVGGAALAALQKVNMSDQVRPKLKFVRGGGEVQTSVANGETEIALGPYVSDMRNPGLDVVGPLPPEVATPVDVTGFISTHAKDPAACKALLDYLSSPGAAAIYKEARMEPAH
jgi:molybdate transport system substrate-binding protein